MDRRLFLALTTLAAAAASPVLAQQVARAVATGEAHHISRDEVIRALYRTCTGGNMALGIKALTELGHAPGEARELASQASSIAKKSMSFENFRMLLLEGRASKDFMLSDRETALIRSLHTKWDGRTWEGSAMRAKPRPAKATVGWDGRTWEGSAR